MKTCKTCKWWSKGDWVGHLSDGHEWGLCNLPLESEKPGVKIWLPIANPLTVREDFRCVEHEERK